MGRTMTSILAIGVGAAAYSMANQKTKQRINQLIQPTISLVMSRGTNIRAWRKMQRNITRAFS